MPPLRGLGSPKALKAAATSATAAAVADMLPPASPGLATLRELLDREATYRREAEQRNAELQVELAAATASVEAVQAAVVMARAEQVGVVTV